MKKSGRKLNLVKVKIIIILIIIGCLVLGGIVPTINSIILFNKNEAINDDYNKKHDEKYKKTGIDDDVRAYASFYWRPKYPDPGEKITFYSSSHAYNGHITSERWNFADEDSAQGRRATQTYEKRGRYKVTLTVSASGIGTGFDWSTRTSYIEVGGDPFPKIKYTPEFPSPDEQVELDGSGSSDPDGKIILYNWSFFSAKNPENVVYLGSDEIIYHTWEKQGIYVVSLITIDDRGNNNTIMETIDVSILKLIDFNKISRGLRFKIGNYGDITAKNLKCTVEIFKLKIIGIGSKPFYHKSNTISNLNPGEFQLINLKNIRRKICKIKLIISAEADNAVKISKTLYGRILGKFIYLTEKNIARSLIDTYNLMIIAGIGFSLLSIILMPFSFILPF